MTQYNPLDSEAAPLQRAETPMAPCRLAKRACNGVAAIMFGCVFIVFAFKITMRYLADDPVAWADEVSVVLFVWILFWGNAFIVEESRQIRFDILYRSLPEGGRRAASMIRLLIVGGLFLWALPSVVDYIHFLRRERTPVLELRLDLVYACFGLFVVAIVVRSAWAIVGLVRPTWRRYI